MSKARLVALTQPTIGDGTLDPEDFIIYAARASNPENQMRFDTAPRLLKYLIEHQHWSPFEMVSACIEVTTTRDISRQMIRHRSFSFQEFSQRYATPRTRSLMKREGRLAHRNNRQSSSTPVEGDLKDVWEQQVAEVQTVTMLAYEAAIQAGIARECARALLPEGLTETTLYMSGTLRSWLHYIELRTTPETQLEHRTVAFLCQQELAKYFPTVMRHIGEVIVDRVS